MNLVIKSIVVHGNHLGRTVGMPTANFDIEQVDSEIPVDGVYASWVVMPNGDIKKGVTNVGFKPSVSPNMKKNIETHILDYDGDLYGLQLEIRIVKRIRDIQKFDSLEQVKKQVDKDIAKARMLLS